MGIDLGNGLSRIARAIEMLGLVFWVACIGLGYPTDGAEGVGIGLFLGGVVAAIAKGFAWVIRGFVKP